MKDKANLNLCIWKTKLNSCQSQERKSGWLSGSSAGLLQRKDAFQILLVDHWWRRWIIGLLIELGSPQVRRTLPNYKNSPQIQVGRVVCTNCQSHVFPSPSYLNQVYGSTTETADVIHIMYVFMNRYDCRHRNFR